jgi:hydrogenase-1 operon protein HyaF
MAVSDNLEMPLVAPASGDVTGNVTPLLHEIRHGLRRLHQSGEPSVIDLLAIPLTAGERDAMLQRLGVGEVRIELLSFGRSRLWETAYPGVWVVDHSSEEGGRIALQIEITDFPVVARSQPEDIMDGLLRLEEELQVLSIR